MTVVESTDSYMNTVWKVVDGWRTVAECFNERDAKVCKEALEKDSAEREKEENDRFF